MHVCPVFRAVQTQKVLLFQNEGYILMLNVRVKMVEYLKYADLKFQDSAGGKGLHA